MRYAIELHGWNLKEAAAELGVGYDWLKRAVTQGVAWEKKPKEGEPSNVDKIAAYFSLGEKKKDLLWDTDARFFDHINSHLRIHVGFEKQAGGVLAYYTGKPKPDYVRWAVGVIVACHEAIRAGHEPPSEWPSGRPEGIYPYTIGDKVELVAGGLIEYGVSAQEAWEIAEGVVHNHQSQHRIDPAFYRLTAAIGLRYYLDTLLRHYESVGVPRVREALPTVTLISRQMAESMEEWMMEAVGIDEIGRLINNQWLRNYAKLTGRSLPQTEEYLAGFPQPEIRYFAEEDLPASEAEQAEARKRIEEFMAERRVQHRDIDEEARKRRRRVVPPPPPEKTFGKEAVLNIGLEETHRLLSDLVEHSQLDISTDDIGVLLTEWHKRINLRLDPPLPPGGV